VVPYRPEVDDPNPPVMLTFARAVATAPECGIFTEDFAFAPRNRNTPNFGCSTQRNLAVMIADPRDLVEPRPLEPADMARRHTVIEAYRQGKTTNVERSDDDSGAVSEVKE
jgi:pilus assembly protein CpaD